MSRILAGGCLCRGVRYRVVGEPIAFYACHCTDCQTASGSAFGLSMILRRDDLELLAGETRTVPVTLPDGRAWTAARCPQCWTRLWGEPARVPQVRTLRPGTLDDTRAWTPYGNIWTASAQPWVSFAPGPCFERQPEDPLAMVKAWQGRPRT